jgi:GT2 family glycosyltransferase
MSPYRLNARIRICKEELFLYCDDIEYTSRILKNGAKIIYLPEQKIIDTDQSFSNSHKKPNPLLD